MKTYGLAVILIGLSLTPKALAAEDVYSAGNLPPWWGCVSRSSRDFAIPIAWIEAVIRAESGGQTHLKGRPITSPAGAMGLMQLMPQTYAELRDSHGLGPDPHDPCDNIRAGTAYLRQMYDRFGYPALFAAYNAGPARYQAYLKGQTLPRETQAYLVKVVRFTPKRTSGDRLFVDLRSSTTDASTTSTLFVPLRVSNHEPQSGTEEGPDK